LLHFPIVMSAEKRKTPTSSDVALPIELLTLRHVYVLLDVATRNLAQARHTTFFCTCELSDVFCPTSKKEEVIIIFLEFPPSCFTAWYP
jgi:hypothetical protein